MKLGVSSHAFKRWGISHTELLNLESPLPCFAQWVARKYGGYHSTYIFSAHSSSWCLLEVMPSLPTSWEAAWAWVSLTSYATRGTINKGWLNLKANPWSCLCHTNMSYNNQSGADVAQAVGPHVCSQDWWFHITPHDCDTIYVLHSLILCPNAFPTPITSVGSNLQIRIKRILIKHGFYFKLTSSPQDHFYI